MLETAAILADQHNLGLILREGRIEPLEGGQFTNTGATPGRPEVQDDELALELIETGRTSVLGQNGDVARVERLGERLVILNLALNRRSGIG